MKFWKVLRWIASALFLAILLWALFAINRAASSDAEGADAPSAPKIY